MQKSHLSVLCTLPPVWKKGWAEVAPSLSCSCFFNTWTPGAGRRHTSPRGAELLALQREQLCGERGTPLFFFIIPKSSPDPDLRICPFEGLHDHCFFLGGGEGGLDLNKARDAGVLLFQDCTGIISKDLEPFQTNGFPSAYTSSNY